MLATLRLVTAYVALPHFGVDLEVVWDTAIDDAPSLKPLIAKILDETEAKSI